MNDQSSTPAASISLPKGGGAIQGIGETFQPNLFTGTGDFSVPIATSSGREGFGPELTLQYSTGKGNGPFGLGWQLSIPRITRKTEKGLPRYTDADVFVMSGSEDLVRCLEQTGDSWEPAQPIVRGDYTVIRYRPRIEGLFARIEQWVRHDGDVHWRTVSKDNVTSLYGKTDAARLVDPARRDDPNQGHRVFEWLLQETFDAKGNHILYEYAADGDESIDAIYEQNRTYAQKYLRRILYGNSHQAVGPERVGTDYRDPLGTLTRRYLLEVVFDYGDVVDHDYPPAGTPERTSAWPVRPDPFSRFRAGFELRTIRRCERALMFHHFAELGGPTLVRSTDFEYDNDPQTRLSLLTAACVTGYRKQADGTYLEASMPPVTFKYSAFTPQEQRYQPLTSAADDLPAWSLGHPEISLVDLQGDGLPDVLHASSLGYRVWDNLSEGRLGYPQFQSAAPAGVIPSQPGVTFGDMAGDGLVDLIVQEPSTAGFYEARSDGQWATFTRFETLPSFDLSDPSVRLVDLTGDGRSDVLQTRDQHLLWFECEGELGYSAPHVIPRVRDLDQFPDVDFGDTSGRVRLADMTGDGLSDIVLVHNGRVDYWPNLGYGKFGARITMAQAPRLATNFDPRRLFLADLDGSGCSDLVYVDFDRVCFWFNRSGNGWSEEHVIHGTPFVTDTTAIQFADVFGTGTATLVWSYDLTHQPAGNYKALDFCGGVKPYILTEMSNNLGATTRVRYAPSTKFYMQDQRAGQPWVTALPFPVQVVEKIEVIDHISKTKLVTTYQYHHGYYDGREREFRGFGRVDQFDTESFEDFTSADLHDANTVFVNGENAFHAPPVETRSWFHTGVYFDPHRLDASGQPFDYDDLTEAYQREYYQGDQQAFPLADHEYHSADGATVPLGAQGASAGPDAYRALRGALLRTEVYGRDGSQKADHPYVVTTGRYQVHESQPPHAGERGVYLLTGIESLTYHYERHPADPRIQHDLTLEVDGYGNSLKSVVVSYGRRQADLQLPLQADRDKQSQTLVTYTENRYTNVVDDYRTPLLCETQTYELTGYTPTGVAGQFQESDFVHLSSGAVDHIFDSELAYEESPTTDRQRRLIEHVRTFYRPDDLGVSRNDPLALLPLGTVESLALPGETYKLAFTPGLVDQVFARDGEHLLPANPGDLLGSGGADRCGYVDLDGNGHWWIPSGRVFYSLDSNDGPASELDHAQNHFFVPHRYRDPFHTEDVSTESSVLYDPYDLLKLETRDAVGNRVTAGERLPNGDLNLSEPGNDYRVLQPWQVMDANRNCTQVAFDTLGKVVGTAMMGKPEENLGDTLDGFVTDLPDTMSLDHLVNPLMDPHALLGRATTRLVYDLFAYHRTKDHPDPQPAVVYMLTRETHDADLASGEQTKLQHSFSYSDGFGREIQSKSQVEPEKINGIPGAPRWIGSGWTILNNKGKSVRQYEPFFSYTHRFEFNVRIGVSPVRFYDPVERVVATLHPNHTWEKVVFDPWRQETWDVNDTILVPIPRTDPDVGRFFNKLPSADYLPTWHALRTNPAHAAEASQRWPDPHYRDAEQRSAHKAAIHAATPTVAHADSLGRTFLTVAHNTFKYSDTSASAPPDEAFHYSRLILDIEGNEREIIDANDRVVMRYDYDMLGNLIHQASMEAGEHWTLNDVAGKPLYAWDSRGHSFRIEYDPLRRPQRSFVTGADAANPNQVFLTERLIYGEQHPEDERLSLRGKLYLHLDQTGSLTSDAHDFKGNPVHVSRRLAREYRRTIDWRLVDAMLPVEAAAKFDTHALEAALAPYVEAEAYTSRTTFDALNRPVAMTTPHTAAILPSVIRHVYNEASLLEQVHANLHGATDHGQAVWTPFITNIDYDAKGQRQRVDYGNDVSTFYEYDPLTFRLIHMFTQRNAVAFPNDCPQPPPADWPGCEVQNLHYIYDPAGNITHIRDDAQQTIYFRNRRVEPSAEYTYDAIYRLIEATGREHLGQVGGTPSLYDHNDAQRVGLLHPGDGNAMGRYLERYIYDMVGNILQMQHRGTDPAHPGGTRSYTYSEASLIEPTQTSNRLSHTTVGNGNPITERYGYDAHGNMNRMPHLGGAEPDSNIHWNYEDQIRQIDLGGGGTAYYTYDASGQRVRKVWEKSANLIEERVYLGGIEIFRQRNGTGAVTLERETLHLMDDRRRIALVETRTLDVAGNDPAPQQLTRYQFSSHLGSASLVLDHEAQMISYEEYTPYGSTSYQAMRNQTETPQRYRYTGKERDEESGLYYHGARYYAPWLGRWINPDPAGLIDGTNLYIYVANNPLKYKDPTGLQPDSEDDDTRQPSKGSADNKSSPQQQIDSSSSLRSHPRLQNERFEVEFLALNARSCMDCHGDIRILNAGIMPYDMPWFARGRTVAANKTVAEIVASMAPGVGEATDVEVITNPKSALWEQWLAGVSLGVSVFTAGLAPNAGALLRGGKRLDEVAEVAGSGMQWRGARGDSIWYHAIDDATGPFRRGNADELIAKISSGNRSAGIKAKPISVRTNMPRSQANAFTNQIELRRGATRVQVLEEFVHVRQAAYKKSLARVSNDLLHNHPVGRLGLNAADWAETVDEVHAKGLLLRYAKQLNLGLLDKMFLRAALKRLRETGVTQGY